MRNPKMICRVIVTASALLLLSCSSLRAQQTSKPPLVVSNNCSGCHGLKGNAQLPDYPKLEAQTSAYIEQRVKTFQGAPEPPSVEIFYAVVLPAEYKKIESASAPLALANMVGPAHSTDAAQLRSAAAWYAAQPPVKGRNAKAELVTEGKSLYQNGVPAKAILACADCHGPNGGGAGSIPRLAGQNEVYLIQQMERFRSGARGHAPEMDSISKLLDQKQIRELAAYLKSL